MCLEIDAAKTKKLRAKLKKHGKLTLWKVYDRMVRPRGDYLLSMIQGMRISAPGVVHSDRRRVELSLVEQDWHEVGIGIHVYLSKNAAKNQLIFANRTIVPVVCHAQHFVAAGEDRTCNDSAVFTQVTITRSAFKNAFKNPLGDKK